MSEKEGQGERGKGGSGRILIRRVRLAILYTSQCGAKAPLKLPDRLRIFPDQTSAVRDRDLPSEKSEDGGDARRARIR